MVDEYQDTNRPQYLLIRRLAEVHRNLCVVGDPGSVDLQVARRRPAEHPRLRAGLSAKRRSSSSNGTTARRRSSSTPRRRSSARTATARTSISGPTARAARGSSTSAAATSSRRPTSSRARRAAALADDVDATVAVLYRTNAQSRTIEDALMREGLAYKIVGGVRFYERKEIKDALAYMRLVINPHDDVSLRRVINVPARGIGKGVMEAVESIAAGDGDRRRSAAARRRPAAGAVGELAVGAARPRPRGARVHRPRGRVAGGVSRSDRQPDRDGAAGSGVDRDRQDARPERLPAGSARGSQRGRARRAIENLAELVSAAREYESREPEPSLGGFVDRLSLLSDVDEEQGTRDARDLADDAAQRQGPRVPDGHPGRPRGRALPALALERGRGGARGGAPAVLRRHDARAARSWC